LDLIDFVTVEREAKRSHSGITTRYFCVMTFSERTESNQSRE